MEAFFGGFIGAVVGTVITLSYEEILDWFCEHFPQIFDDEEDDEDD